MSAAAAVRRCAEGEPQESDLPAKQTREQPKEQTGKQLDRRKHSNKVNGKQAEKKPMNDKQREANTDKERNERAPGVSKKYPLFSSRLCSSLL